MELVVGDFKGRAPRRSDRLLPESYSTVAQNVHLTAGELRGMKMPLMQVDKSDVDDLDARKAFRVREPDLDMDDWWFAQSREAELIKSPLVNDSFHRWYLFERGHPPRVGSVENISSSVQDELEFFDVAIESPTLAPSIQVVEDEEADEDLREERVYVYTYVTEWGEESAPSPSSSVTMGVSASAQIGNFYDSPIPQIEGRAYEHVRIYRTVVGQSSTRLHFVADVPFGDEEYFDQSSNSEVVFNSTLTRFYDPPEEGIYGARVHPSGSVVAFKGRQLYFSRPYMPHSWPGEWRISLQDEIVAVEIVGQDIIVLTGGQPAIVYGADVSALGVNTFPSSLPCANYNSVVGAPEGVYYVSEEGLVLMATNGPQLVSIEVLTKHEWRTEFFRDDWTAARHQNQYVAVNEDGNGFVLDRTSGNLEVHTISGLDEPVALDRDRYSGRVFVLSKNRLYEWDPPGSEEVGYIWRSKEFYFPEPVNFETVQLEIEEVDEAFEPQGIISEVPLFRKPMNAARMVGVRVWADGKLVTETPATNRETVRLASGFRATVWQFELVGQLRVHRVTMTRTAKGQARV